jgi:hypothetical protein
LIAIGLTGASLDSQSAATQNKLAKFDGLRYRDVG